MSTAIQADFSFSKLSSGQWGVRGLPGKSGHMVTVTKKDGSQKSITLGKTVKKYGDMAVYEIKQDSKPAPRRYYRDECPVCGEQDMLAYLSNNTIRCDECGNRF